jgi:hypothetical protein
MSGNLKIMNKILKKSKYCYSGSISAVFILTLILTAACGKNSFPAGHGTICNPVDLNYRFQIKPPSYREGADPTVIWFKDRYYLFASMSGGYWHSKDLADWSFIESGQIPTEDYAPTAIVIQEDGREVTLKWTKQSNATGYNVRYGIAPDKLYQNYQVLDTDSLTIRSLNSLLDYYFTIEAFNENGIRKSERTVGSKRY